MRDAFEREDYETASEMLNKAIEVLERAEKISQFLFKLLNTKVAR